MKIKINKKFISLCLFAIYFIYQAITQQNNPTKFNLKNNPTIKISPTPIKGVTIVVSVIDGDTIILNDQSHLRYIGVDTPELHHPKIKLQCFGEEAKIANQKLVEGKEIIMETDVSNVDRYKRLLRYVWVKNNNSSNSAIFVNDYLVRQGFAYASTFPPDVKYAKQFIEAETEARENNRGLWSKCETP